MNIQALSPNYPLLRAQHNCARCGDPKDSDQVLCWPCFQFVKRDPNCTAILDGFEDDALDREGGVTVSANMVLAEVCSGGCHPMCEHDPALP